MSTLNSSIKITFQKPESRVVLYGNPATDHELQDSARKLRMHGRQVAFARRPQFDTGLGRCGNHLCSCTEHCKKELFSVNANTGKPTF